MCIHTRCGTRAGTTLPTKAPICAPCRITSAIAIRGTPCTTRVSLAVGSRGCGNERRRAVQEFVGGLTVGEDSGGKGHATNKTDAEVNADLCATSDGSLSPALLARLAAIDDDQATFLNTLLYDAVLRWLV